MIVSSSRRPRAREGSSSSRGSPPGPSSTRPRRCTGASAATRPPRLDEPVRLPVLDRYLARELVSPFAFACALLTFFLVIDRIYHLTDLVITKGVPLHLVLELLAFMLPLFVAYTLPMALLVAVLLAGGRLASDLEIVAFKAAGVSALRLFRPVLAASVLIAGATAVLTLVVNPAASAEFQRQLFRILQARALSGLQERVFNTTFGELTIYVEDVSASQVALRGILVSDERDPTLSRIISSREGRLLTDEVNRSITLRMIDGAVNEADILPVDLPKEVATKDSSPTTGGAASVVRARRARAPDRNGAGVAVAGDAGGVADARGGPARGAGRAPPVAPARRARAARLDAHHRSVPRARVLDVHGDRAGGGGGPLRGDRPRPDPRQVSPGEAAGDVHPGALRVPAAGGAARRAAGGDAGGNDLPVPDLEPIPRADPV